jgi:hypothetical protein
MQADLLTFRRVYWRLGAVIWRIFVGRLQVARLTKALRCADVSVGGMAAACAYACARRGGATIVREQKKLRESAAKLLKSFARVNLCARRKKSLSQLARRVDAPYERLSYFDARDATRSRAPGAPAVTARE